MNTTDSQKTKAEQLKALHHQKKMLVLPNIWDPLGAALLEDLGYQAIATASAPVAFTSGFDDGQKIPFSEVLGKLERIVDKVDIPVTADIESGYANDNTGLAQNIEALIKTGVVGINLEDFNIETGAFFLLADQCERIMTVRKVSENCGIPLFINARTDVYLKGKNFASEKAKFEETLQRGRAYLDAGADCIFPPAMKDADDLKKLIDVLRCPVNVLAFPGTPDFQELKEIGVARLSLGPAFLKIAIKAMKETALKLKNGEGLDEIKGNSITSDYLKHLV
jgi:2-methylisocitrate lyase-like PEP mutase family enzyme